MPSLQAISSIITTASLLVLTASATNSKLDTGINANTSQATSRNTKIYTTGAKSSTTGASLPPSHEFLIAHNKVRTSLGEPPLKWDKNLAHYARRWASKRIVDCKMVHSFGPYGENIFWGGQDHWTPTDVVRSWVDEYKYYDKESNDCEPEQMCGHYTQVVWRDSLRLGCARVKCNSGGVFFICNYDPPGNYVNESPFDTMNTLPTDSTTTTTPSPPSDETPTLSGTVSATQTSTFS